MSDMTNPAYGGETIVPSDTVNQRFRALYVGVAGNISIVHASDPATSVVYVAVPVGVFPVSGIRVNLTGTAATDMVALK